MRRIATGIVFALLAVAVGIAAPDRDGKRWWSFVGLLASDDMQGRNTGSPAHRKAADLVAAEFKRVGVASRARRAVTSSRSTSPAAKSSRPRAASSWCATASRKS